MGLPKKRVSLVPDNGKPRPMMTVPWGGSEELEAIEDYELYEGGDFCCAVDLAKGIEQISSVPEAYAARRMAAGRLILATTTKEEGARVGKYLKGAGFAVLCTFPSKDGLRELTLWGALAIK